MRLKGGNSWFKSCRNLGKSASERWRGVHDDPENLVLRARSDRLEHSEKK